MAAWTERTRAQLMRAWLLPPAASLSLFLVTSSARRLSGTRCSRFAFIRVAGTVHTAPAVSISSHVSSRTSPDRTAVSTGNPNASLTAG